MLDGMKCYLCHKDFPLHELELEHKTPRSRGGTNGLMNMGLACRDCNQEKADMTEKEYRAYLKQKGTE